MAEPAVIPVNADASHLQIYAPSDKELNNCVKMKELYKLFVYTYVA